MAMKGCPKCNAQVGPRTKKCNCGHEFVAPTTMSVPASGKSMTLDPLDKRIAASVDSAKDILARAEKRPSVVSAQAVELPQENDVDPRRSTISLPQRSYGGRVIAPAGPCPVIPKGFKKGWPDGPASDEVVQEWAFAVRNYGDGRFTSEAVVYWIQYFWNVSGPEYRRIRELVIKALCPKPVYESSEELVEAAV